MPKTTKKSPPKSVRATKKTPVGGAQGVNITVSLRGRIWQLGKHHKPAQVQRILAESGHHLDIKTVRKWVKTPLEELDVVKHSPGR